MDPRYAPAHYEEEKDFRIVNIGQTAQPQLGSGGIPISDTKIRYQLTGARFPLAELTGRQLG